MINDEQSNQREISTSCYFCCEVDLGSCLTRSLYHKYNDSTNKTLQLVNILVEEQNTTKGKITNSAKKYEQIKHLIDQNQHISGFTNEKKAVKMLRQSLEYYKFRKFVPLFSKTVDNLKITQQLHVYYYDKLKLYYNEIKKKLNITIQQSELSQIQSSNSFVSKSSIASKSKLLDQSTLKQPKQSMKESIKNYQTQSKALQNLLQVLTKNQDKLKYIKKLTAHSVKNEVNVFRDTLQKRQNLVNIFPNTTFFKKKGNFFFRTIEHSKDLKINDQTSKNRSSKKLSGDQPKDSLYYESIKLSANNQNAQKLRRQRSRNNAKSQESLKLRKNSAKKFERRSSQNIMQRYVIKSLPKIKVQFNIKSGRSSSSTSLNNYNNCNVKACKPLKVKQIDYTDKLMSQIRQGSDKKKQKIVQIEDRVHDNPSKNASRPAQIQIVEQNLASLNRKKIQQLKMRSQRKKTTK